MVSCNYLAVRHHLSDHLISFLLVYTDPVIPDLGVAFAEDRVPVVLADEDLVAADLQDPVGFGRSQEVGWAVLIGTVAMEADQATLQAAKKRALLSAQF